MVTNHLFTGMILQVDIIGSLSFHIHTGKFSHGNLKNGGLVQMIYPFQLTFMFLASILIFRGISTKCL